MFESARLDWLIGDVAVAPENHLILEEGAKIAVVGGGPTGSLFSLFAVRQARLIDRRLQITIFEPREFAKHGPAGCNRCGGVISELLVQTLALECIHLPETVVQRGINSYQLHTAVGSVGIATPHLENTIATVHRGGGPAGPGRRRRGKPQRVSAAAGRRG